jgi:hypothetical protein
LVLVIRLAAGREFSEFNRVSLLSTARTAFTQDESTGLRLEAILLWYSARTSVVVLSSNGGYIVVLRPSDPAMLRLRKVFTRASLSYHSIKGNVHFRPFWANKLQSKLFPRKISAGRLAPNVCKSRLVTGYPRTVKCKLILNHKEVP